MSRSNERHLFLTSNGLTDSMKRKLFSLIGENAGRSKGPLYPHGRDRDRRRKRRFCGLPARTCSHGDSPEHIQIYNLELIVSRDYPRTYSAYIQELPMVSRLLTLDELQRFDVVFVSGGDCAVLCREMKRTGLTRCSGKASAVA